MNFYLLNYHQCLADGYARLHKINFLSHKIPTIIIQSKTKYCITHPLKGNCIIFPANTDYDAILLANYFLCLLQNLRYISSCKGIKLCRYCFPSGTNKIPLICK